MSVTRQRRLIWLFRDAATFYEYFDSFFLNHHFRRHKRSRPGLCLPKHCNNAAGLDRQTSMAQQNLRILSLDQIQTVSFYSYTPPRTAHQKFYNPSSTGTGSWIRFFAFIRIGCHIDFHRTCDSYLVIPAFLASDETDALLARSRQLLNEFSLQDHPLVRLFITKSSLRCCVT